MRSIRFQFFSFMAVLLVTLLVLLNIYPMASSRDMVFEEKKSAMSNQASVIASSLAGLDRLTEDSVSEVMRLLDVSGYTRTVVAGPDGVVLYDDGGRTGIPAVLEPLNTALDNKTVFRSRFADAAFSSSYAMPVVSQGQTKGAVYLHEYDTERAELIIDVQSRIRIASLAISGAALLLAVVFSAGLLRRIRELAKSMRIVAGGNYEHRIDVTGQDEITELGNEFNMLTQRLEETEEQRRRFVADASHELKTPLASIRLLSDSIVQSDNIDPGTVREFVTDIGNEAERLQRTTEKLLALSRLDDSVQIVPEPVDMKQVTMDALALLQPLADERDIELQSELEDGCVVMATVDDMFHIIFNLAENAVKYNVNGGSVQITLQAEENSVTLSVADTGIGIPEEDRLNIFSRFYRVDKARSREAGGSGLGLSIVHDAVLAHGGTIAVGQNKPRGSRFIVTFPRPTSEETGI